MGKSNAIDLIFDRMGYGPLVIPPLVIVTIFSFAFVLTESRVISHTQSGIKPANQSTKHAQPNKKAQITTVILTDIESLPAIDASGNPVPSQSGAPQSSTVTSNALQSASSNPTSAINQNTKPNTPSGGNNSLLNQVNSALQLPGRLGL